MKEHTSPPLVSLARDAAARPVTSPDAVLTPAHALRDRNHPSRERLPRIWDPPGIGFAFVGVILPALTLAFEAVTHACARDIFDPIPTWWHVLLVALVPISNAFAWHRARTEPARSAPWLHHLSAAAIAISAIYFAMFLPMAPFAIIGIVLGIGIFALAPVAALFPTVRAWRMLPASAPRARLFWPGFIAGLGALVFPFAWEMLTRDLLAGAAAGSPEQRLSAVTWLRQIGSERTLREASYRARRHAWWFMDSEWRSEAGVEAIRGVYYRVTGAPYNSLPAPTGVSLTGGRARGGWNFDPHVGGDKVADKVPGLMLESSRLDGKVDATGLTSYTEWTFVFKNFAANASEARAQIELPPGGVVSRLTLWIDGEPREAAFGSRAQVRAAYKEVAVVQRRDPVLVNTCGPDRILMQCFPVLPNGGEMKVRVGITAPLRLADARTAAVDWPRLIETNFSSADSLRHTAWIEGNAPFADGSKMARRDFTEATFAAEPALRLALPDAARDSIADDPNDPQFVIQQKVKEVQAARPRKVVWVIDGSRAMREHWPQLVALAAQADRAPAAAWFAGDTPAHWEPRLGSLGAWLSARSPRGGADNGPALEAAWDATSLENGGAIVWLHGPQPVELSSFEPLLQRAERSPHRPQLIDLAVTPAPNRIAEKLDAIAWQRAIDGATPAERLTRLLDSWNGRATAFTVERQRFPRAALSGKSENADRHVARLWAREEIERLRNVPATLDSAIKLALQLQLVTPISGAVVLERKEQYERHGLSPVDAATVPTVPEPATAALLTLGAAWLAARRPRTKLSPRLDSRCVPAILDT